MRRRLSMVGVAVLLIGGAGIGCTRQAVRDTLRTSQYIARFAPEPDSAGGDGATQIWLK